MTARRSVQPRDRGCGYVMPMALRQSAGSLPACAYSGALRASNVFDHNSVSARHEQSFPIRGKTKMKTAAKAYLALCGLLCNGTAFADAHDLSYLKITRGAGTVVRFAGEPHTMVAIPVRELVLGSRYTIVFPAPAVFAGYTFALVSAIHNSDAFVPNITIDSFPAQVHLSDGLNYTLVSDGLGGYDFQVTGSATVSVSIDLGDTILSISNTLNAKDTVTGLPILTDVNIPSTNAVPFAEYGKYLDKVTLVNALDAWIDYIRVVPR
jgi:hypothetical protein